MTVQQRTKKFGRIPEMRAEVAVGDALPMKASVLDHSSAQDLGDISNRAVARL